MAELSELVDQAERCTLCAERFAATRTAHRPRPVVWLSNRAPILIAGQAPGARVHASGLPFDDRSGDRLRDWLGVERADFYDRDKFAILPMAFCFPGYDAKGSDLPPPRICAATWRAPAMMAMPQVRVKVLIGGYAQKWHLGTRQNVTQTVESWRDHPEGTFALPHPSWRNTGWLRRHPWFEQEVVPRLRDAVSLALDGRA